jgi:DNA-binding NarL/FixJ family response regulator
MTTFSIVEDIDILRQSFVQLLTSTGEYTCVGAYNDYDILLNELPLKNPDFIIMDIDLAGKNGINGVKKIKTQSPHKQIVMLTVFEDDTKIFEAIMAGASGYLLKRTPPLKLLESLRELLDGGSPMNSSIAAKVLQMLRFSNQSPQNKFALTPREIDVLQGLVDGLSYKLIADKHFVSLETVRSHIKNIYEKLQVHSKSEAIVKAIQQKIVKF